MHKNCTKTYYRRVLHIQIGHVHSAKELTPTVQQCWGKQRPLHAEHTCVWVAAESSPLYSTHNDGTRLCQQYLSRVPCNSRSSETV